MKHIRFTLAVAITLALAGLSLLPTVQPAVAQSSTTITSAVFSIYVQDVSNQTVRVHRITAPWNEPDVTWASFNSAFDPAVVGSFVADSTGWHTVTVTSLVQAWVNDPTQNYGLLLEQGLTTFTTYNSSEFYPADERPMLDVCYIRNGGPETCMTVQRPGSEQGNVADAYIWDALPDYNAGSTSPLYSGLFSGPLGTGLKYALVRFELRTPTAIHLQSLSARSSVSPDVALAVLGVASVVGVVIVRRRRR